MTTTATKPTATIRQLRDLVPLRPLSMAESLRIAELQAMRLLELAGVEKPPVPETIITRLPRIQVERLPLDHATSGITEWSHGRWLILINAGQVHGRQRYSIGHEFKHVLDGPLVRILYPGVVPPEHNDQWEYVCDFFSACLLMPRSWVKRYFCDEGIQSVRALAARFDVSQQAMAYRLTQLALVEPTTGRHGRGVRR